MPPGAVLWLRSLQWYLVGTAATAATAVYSSYSVPEPGSGRGGRVGDALVHRRRRAPGHRARRPPPQRRGAGGRRWCCYPTSSDPAVYRAPEYSALWMAIDDGWGDSTGLICQYGCAMIGDIDTTFGSFNAKYYSFTGGGTETSKRTLRWVGRASTPG